MCTIGFYIIEGKGERMTPRLLSLMLAIVLSAGCAAGRYAQGPHEEVPYPPKEKPKADQLEINYFADWESY